MGAKEQAIRTAEMGGKLANMRRENVRLENLVKELKSIVESADSGRTLHCGFYTAKDYRFTQGQIDRLKSMINPAPTRERNRNKKEHE